MALELRFGRAKIKVLETPGQTPESTCGLATGRSRT